jgi:hypothetical protein
MVHSLKVSERECGRPPLHSARKPLAWSRLNFQARWCGAAHSVEK